MDLSATGRRLLTVTGVAGIGYTLSWITGLSVPAPSPNLAASGAEIAAAFAGHGTAMTAQFALTEGLPAAGLAVVSIVLARAARRSGAAAAAQVPSSPAGRPRSSRWGSSCSAWCWPQRPHPALRTCSMTR